MKKKIIVSLLAILTVIPLVLVRPKAAGSTLNGSGTSNYGSYNYQFSVILEQTEIGFNWGAEGLGLNIPLATGSSFNINFQFKDTYTGYVQFTLKSNTGVGYRLDECYWGVNGGYFNSSYLPSLTTVSTSKQFRIYVYNATEFSFTIVSPNVNTFHPTSTQYTGFGVTSFGYVLTDVGDIPDIYADIDLYIPGMSTSLSNISDNTDTMAADIATLKEFLDGVEGGIDLLNQALYDLRVPIDTIYLNWNTAVSGGTTGYVSNSSDPNLYIYKTDLGGISISRTDARFSSYDVINGNYIILKWFFDMSGTGSSSQYYEFDNLRFQWRDPSGNLNNLNIFTGDSLSFTKFVEYNITRNSYILTIYCPASCFIGSNSSVTFYDFAIDQFTLNNVEGIGFMFGGMSDTLPYDSQYLSLLESINNGIGALNDDYDTSTYDNYEQTLDGLNDGLRGRFDNVDNNLQTNVDTLFTPSGTAGSDGSVFEKFHFNAVNSFMSGFINSIFTSFPAFKYILIFALLLLVIGVMI